MRNTFSNTAELKLYSSVNYNMLNPFTILLCSTYVDINDNVNAVE